MENVVSVYIPTRNRQHLLDRALRSVMCQTYVDIEVVVVNDCSTDNTREYLDALAAREPRLIALHMETPRGAPAARNRAIRAATAPLITGLDDDDEFRSDRIALFVSQWAALGAKADTISCLFTESIMTDGITSAVTTDRKDRVTYLDLFRHNFIGNQVFCPRERLLAIGGFDEAMPAWQDLEMFMRLVKHYGEACRINEPTYTCYVERGRERISTSVDKRTEAFRRIVDKNKQVSADLHHQLFLELFSPFYGTVPTLSDWKTLLPGGRDPSCFYGFFAPALEIVCALEREGAC